MSIGITRSTRRNDGHPAQMRGPALPRKAKEARLSLAGDATNTLGKPRQPLMGDKAKTPGGANASKKKRRA